MRERPDLPIGGWLAIGFGTAGALLVVASVAALVLLARLEEAERRQAEVVAPRAEAALRLERDLLAVAITARAYALTPEPGRLADAREAVAAARSSLSALARYPKTREGVAAYERAAPLLDTYFARAEAFVEGVGVLPPSAEAEATLRGHREAALEALRSYSTLQARRAQAASAEVLALELRTRRTLAGVAATVLALLAVTALVVTRMVRVPALELAEAARRVAGGDWTAGAGWASPVRGPRRNELAEIQRAFGRMASDLQEREARIVAQNEELQAQQEELQVQNEELQAQQEELQSQNEELQTQQEELQVQNEELETQAVQLHAHEEQLREADRRKDEFIAVLSHELRNPLASIVNALHLVENVDPAGETARRARAVMRRQVKQLTRLVEDLLDVTRIRRGKVHLRRGRVELAALVRHVAEDHAATIAGRDVALDLRLPAGELWVDADPARLAQILGNLLHNGAKFTPSGGRVQVALEAQDGARALLRVSDTGVGIPPEVLAELFQPFTQADRSLARTDGGLGLGLALVKGLVELHGGAVRAASDGVGRGAEFTVELPLSPTPPPQAATALPPSGARRRVLVVEDNVDAAESLAELLRLAGHDVELAPDGPAGVRAALAAPPDVVLCDVGLPGLDGYAVARRLRAEPALDGTLVVALSGYAQPEDVQRARDAGFDAHLTKPASPDDLEGVLRLAAREPARERDGVA